jgi:hypothetical protein
MHIRHLWESHNSRNTWRPGRKWMHYIKMNLRRMILDVMDCIRLARTSTVGGLL